MLIKVKICLKQIHEMKYMAFLCDESSHHFTLLLHVADLKLCIDVTLLNKILYIKLCRKFCIIV